MRDADAKKESKPALVNGLRRYAHVRARRILREAGADRAKLQRRSQAEQERKNRDELAGYERADEQMHYRVAQRRYREELAERIAAAPDKGLDVDLQDSGERKGTERVDDFDAPPANRKVTQSGLRPFARSWP